MTGKDSVASAERYSISRVDHKSAAPEIAALFAANGYPGFTKIIDEGYGGTNARSWIGRDEHGELIMHVALFAVRVGTSSMGWNAAIVGDLVVDEKHRNFFNALRLLRAAINSARENGFELLFSDPIPRSAGLLKAAGFVSFGSLRRYVAVTSWLSRSYARLRGARRLLLSANQPIDAAHFDGWPQQRHTSRVFRTMSEYQARLVLRKDESRWLVMKASPADMNPTAIALISLENHKRAVLLDAVWDDSRVVFEDVLVTVSAECARLSKSYLDLRLFEPSELTRRARRIGLVRRKDFQPVMIKQLQGLPVPVGGDWYMSNLDGSSWA